MAAARGGYTTVVGPEHRARTVKALLDALVQDFELRKARSLKSIKSHVKSVKDAFGHWTAVALTEDAVNRYIAGRCEGGACERAASITASNFSGKPPALPDQASTADPGDPPAPGG